MGFRTRVSDASVKKSQRLFFTWVGFFNRTIGCQFGLYLNFWYASKKNFICNFYKDKALNTSNLELLKDLKTYYQHGIENIVKIAETRSCIPLHSAEYERGFSRLNNIKTEERINLKVITLEKLLMISLNQEFCYMRKCIK